MSPCEEKFIFRWHSSTVSIHMGVIDGCSKIFADWRQTPDAEDLREIVVDDCRCLELTHQLWKMGFSVGPSSGLNLAAAMDAAVD